MNYLKNIILFFLIIFESYLVAENISTPIFYSNNSILNSTFVISTPGAYAFPNDTTYNYAPTNPTVGRPMIKITTSNITIDFNCIGMYNTDNSSTAWVAIEIGWTPAELIADPTRVQPNNVVIKNFSLYNFDVGVLIHKGSKWITVSDCFMYGTVLGVGALGTSTSKCQDIMLRSIALFGPETNLHSKLVDLKTYIETTCNYGGNYFMPLKPDPLNSNTVDVYTYYGIWLNHIMGGEMKNVDIHKVGYQNYLAVSEGNGARSEAVGIRVQNAKDFLMDRLQATGSGSELKAVGLQLDNAANITINNGNFSSNASKTKAVGLELTNISGATYAAQEITMDNVATKNNSSISGIAIGMDLSVGVGMQLKGIVSSSNVGALQAYGFYASSLTGVEIKDSIFNANISFAHDVFGIYIANANGISLRNTLSSANFTTGSAKNSWGIYFATSATAIKLIDVSASGNSSTFKTYGIQIDAGKNILMENVSANNNLGGGINGTNKTEVYGIFFKATVGAELSQSCLLEGVTATGNINACRAYGLYMQVPTNVEIANLDVSRNLSNVTTVPSFSQAVGAYFEQGSVVDIVYLHANGNTQSETSAVNLYTDSGVSTLENVKNIGNQIAHHFPVQNQSGAYGVFVDGTSNMTIDGGSICGNDGVRAFGICGRNAKNISIKNVDASRNIGRGGIWWSNDSVAANIFTAPDNVNTAIKIEEKHRAPFYGYTAASNVNLRLAFENLLKALNKESTNAAVHDNCSLSAITNRQDIVSMYSLIWSSLAKFRRFCTGVGIGLFNCRFPTVDSCRTLGNSSDYDSAAGIAIYGGTDDSAQSCVAGTIGLCDASSDGAVVTNCIVGNNSAWDISERGGQGAFAINGSVNIAAWNPLFTFLNMGRMNGETVTGGASNDTYGFAAFPSSVVKSTHLDPKPTAMTQPDGATTNNWTLSARKLTVGFPAGTVPVTNPPGEVKNLYNFASPFPLSVGILLESQRDGMVSGNNVYGTRGNSGTSVGILSDGALSSMIVDNKLVSNNADVLGQAWGMADFALTTTNIWYKNWMYANRVDTYLNSSYMIVFDQTKVPGESLPCTTIYPGETEGLSKQSSQDNVIVFLQNQRQISASVHEDMETHWLSTLSVIS